MVELLAGWKQSARSAIKRRLGLARRRPQNEVAEARAIASSTDFWTRFNVTKHHAFSSSDESLEYFHWRNAQYYGYIDLLPVSGRDGEVVLDYGCGPGHDLVGFACYSRPRRLIGMDVSTSSLHEAERRLELHGATVELVLIDETERRLPLEDDSVDYIHSSGVLHHTPDPERILREFRRVLRPGGEVRVMVYNYDSIFVHLYTAYLVQIEQRRYADVTLRDAFRELTDGPNCPISDVYRPDEFLKLAEAAGLRGELLGCAVANSELEWLSSKRFAAVASRKLGREHRDFLTSLRFDSAGLPLYGGAHAGIDGCYRLEAASAP